MNSCKDAHKIAYRLSLLGVLLLSACAPSVAQRGNRLDAERLEQIIPGQTRREDVASLLGTPSVVSPFNDNIWFYVGRRTEQMSFLDPEVTDQTGVKVQFDAAGVVERIDRLDPEQSEPDLKTEASVTPTYGRDLSLMEELLGGLNRFGRKLDGQ